ncbi:hypothetical protein TRFO_31775 [Tritrichomonas foetus]|uniref:COP9 signalosome complex subunit 3 n=1 Tax=Tritrichomonas foetus TaxID=1144522 RepID=A0A1J4JVX9_9EUKA|nr:hypothetical protein TRFO_31775 [Tritrichomonas foetus]|eukprot:OHT01445.1 hypothetical protein TRFO_31775 [Tritrichomonas foetus]
MVGYDMRLSLSKFSKRCHNKFFSSMNMDFMAMNKDKKNNLIAEIKKIVTFNDLTKIGSLIEEGQSLDVKTATDLFNIKQMKDLPIPSMIALILIAPLKTVPGLIFQYIENVYFQNLPTFVELHNDYKTGIVMRYVRAAVLCSKGVETFKNGFLHQLQKENPGLYSAPLLYLAAQIDNPMTLNIRLTKNPRIDTLTTYYLGVNYIMLKNWDEAEKLLIKALALSKYCKDIRPSIIHKMSLASFLNKTPKSVFTNRIAPKNLLPGQSSKIWGLDGNYDSDRVDFFYRAFAHEIRQEHIRRVIIDFAETTTRVLLTDLTTACGFGNTIKPNQIEEHVKALIKAGEIQASISKDFVEFESVSLQAHVETEMNNVCTILGNIKA